MTALVTRTPPRTSRARAHEERPRTTTPADGWSAEAPRAESPPLCSGCVSRNGLGPPVKGTQIPAAAAQANAPIGRSEGSMTQASKVCLRPDIPVELRRKVPPFVLLGFNLRRFSVLFGLGLSVLFLYGPIFRHPDHNGIRYLVGPWLCPLLAAAYYLLLPFNPYRGIGARSAGLVDGNEHDSDAQRLVEIYQSKEARLFLVAVAFKTSAGLFVIMAVITFASRASIQWSLVSPWLVPGLLGCSIGSLITVGCYYVAWGIQKWAGMRGNG